MLCPMALTWLGLAALAGLSSFGPAVGTVRPPGGATAPPLAVTTTYLPEGADGASYAAVLSTSGSLGYCGWSISRGRLPNGLQMALGLGCQAEIVGTPAGNPVGDYRFVVNVYDSTGGFASATLGVRLGRRARPTVAPAALPPSPVPFRSSSAGAQRASLPDWSGYVAAGGPYREVEGSFSVPYIATGLSACQDEVAEWVGVNGADTLAPGAGRSLVQAGISEGMTDPFTGVCRPGQFYLWPWWEVPPKAEEPSYAVAVHVGDLVTVSLRQMGASTWQIRLRDDANGQSFAVQAAYAAPARSAEWVVEASEVPGLCWPGVAPQVNLGICQLAPFSPSVAFSGMGLAGPYKTLWRADMVQVGSRVATPTALSSSRFAIAYTGRWS